VPLKLRPYALYNQFIIIITIIIIIEIQRTCNVLNGNDTFLVAECTESRSGKN